MARHIDIHRERETALNEAVAELAAGFPVAIPTETVYGLAADPHTVGEHVASLTSVMPRDVAKLIGDQLLQVVTTSEGKKGFGLIIARYLEIMYRIYTHQQTGLGLADEAAEATKLANPAEEQL